MSATLILVRHGQTDWNVNGRYMGWTDEGLNEEGLRQAERAGAETRPVADSTRSIPVRSRERRGRRR